LTACSSPARFSARRGLSVCNAALAVAGLAGIAGTAHAGEVYGQAGIPGVTVGYAHSVNAQLGLRVDASTSGTIKKDSTESGIPYSAKAKYERVGLFGDFFPFGGRFRFTGGLTLNKATLDLTSKFDGATPVTVNGKTVTPAAGDYLNGQLKFPNVMPYVGIGWGHQEREAGIGFVADIGVSIGTAKLSTHTNLVGQYGITQADVDAKTAELDDAVGKVHFLPQASVGLNYRF
jgi:hypothetical protein